MVCAVAMLATSIIGRASHASRARVLVMVISSSSLQQLRRAVGAVHRDMAGRAVLKPRIGDVVERRRLRSGSGHLCRRVAFEAELRDRGSLELMRVLRAVRFMTAAAIAGRD